MSFGVPSGLGGFSWVGRFRGFSAIWRRCGTTDNRGIHPGFERAAALRRSSVATSPPRKIPPKILPAAQIPAKIFRLARCVYFPPGIPTPGAESMMICFHFGSVAFVFLHVLTAQHNHCALRSNCLGNMNFDRTAPLQSEYHTEFREDFAPLEMSLLQRQLLLRCKKHSRIGSWILDHSKILT